MQISFNTKPALTLMSCNFGLEITKELNDYIEESVFPKNIDESDEAFQFFKETFLNTNTRQTH